MPGAPWLVLRECGYREPLLLEVTLSHALDDVRAELRELLRARSLRATAVRVEVLVLLHEQARPLTHEQVLEALPTGAYDQASVWRVLSALAEHGILRRMDLGDRVWRYELRDACRPGSSEHPHFLCEQCGTVQCLPLLEVRAPGGSLPHALRGAEFQVRVSGTCSDCRAA